MLRQHVAGPPGSSQHVATEHISRRPWCTSIDRGFTHLNLTLRIIHENPHYESTNGHATQFCFVPLKPPTPRVKGGCMISSCVMYLTKIWVTHVFHLQPEISEHIFLNYTQYTVYLTPSIPFSHPKTSKTYGGASISNSAIIDLKLERWLQIVSKMVPIRLSLLILKCTKHHWHSKQKSNGRCFSQLPESCQTTQPSLLIMRKLNFTKNHQGQHHHR